MVWGTLVVAVALAQSGPQVVVLTDGTAVRVVAPPRIDGRLALLSLADGGLVSVPVERIDVDRSAVVNQGERERAEAEAVAVARAAERARQSPGPARHRGESPWVTNRVLDEFMAAVPPLPVPSSGELAAVTELDERSVSPPIERRPEVDAEGNPRRYWQDQAADLRRAVLDAERDLASARRNLEAEEQRLLFGRTVQARGQGFSVTYHGMTEGAWLALEARISQLQERVSQAEDEVDRLHDREAELRDQARRAGAAPGWLRVPVIY